MSPTTSSFCSFTIECSVATRSPEPIICEKSVRLAGFPEGLMNWKSGVTFLSCWEEVGQVRDGSAVATDAAFASQELTLPAT